MTERDLSSLLREHAADQPVGPPPLAAMHRDAGRRRRGRVTVGGAVVAVVVVAGLAVTSGRGSTEPEVAAPARPVVAPVEEPPAGSRWVGMGRVAVAVPEEWGMNATRCGTPRRDTAIVYGGPVCLALVPFPAGTTSVELRAVDRSIDRVAGWRPGQVDGEPSSTGPLTCERGYGDEPVCTQRLLLTGPGVVVEVRSSRGRGTVHALLDEVRVLDRGVAVPDFTGLAAERQGRSGEAYAAALERAGLAADVRAVARGRGFPPGYVLGVSPAPGTVVAPGSPVVVTVVADPDAATTVAPPDSFRWVGVEHVAVAVPETWGLNATRCGTPTRDTAIVYAGGVDGCLVPFPADTTSVELRPRHRFDDAAGWEQVEVDGGPALRGPVECGAEPDVCRQQLLVVDQDVVVEAASSRGAEAVTAALARVTVLEDRVAVPDFTRFWSPRGTSEDRYAAELERLGLLATVRTEPPGDFLPGMVLDVSPAVGSMVAPGGTVVVTVAE